MLGKESARVKRRKDGGKERRKERWGMEKRYKRKKLEVPSISHA